MTSDSGLNQCIRWKLYSDEYVIKPNKTLIVLYHQNLTLQEDQYYFNNKRELFVCVPQPFQPPFYYVDLMYVCEWLVSIISLILCVIMHYLKSKSNANRSLVCHQISLIVFYFLGMVYVVSKSDSLIWFSFIKYCATYTCRAAFCWLTVINFDKWQQLRPENITRPFTSTTRFYLESLFAWSVPAILIGIAFAMKFLGVKHTSDYMILHQNFEQEMVLYSGTAIILVINIVLFLMTVRNLRIYGKSISQVNKNIFDQLAALYLKLMIVTGVNSILLVFEWAIILYLPFSLWIIADSLYALQGFFIFLVYHFKVSTLKNLGKKLRWLVTCSKQNP